MLARVRPRLVPDKHQAVRRPPRAAAEFAGRDAKRLAEPLGKVALVREAGSQRHLGQRQARGDQKLGGRFKPAVTQEFTCGAVKMGAETARQMHWMHTDSAGDIAQRHVARVAIADPFAGTLQPWGQCGVWRVIRGQTAEQFEAQAFQQERFLHRTWTGA